MPHLLPLIINVSTTILVGYTGYVTKFSLKKSAIRSKSIAAHNVPGVLISLLGTAGWLVLVYQLELSGHAVLLDQWWFWSCYASWLVAFLGNTATGFFMIPLLPNVDPAVKREFISLVLCQVSFVPVFLAQAYPEWSAMMKFFCFTVCATGFVMSVANFVLYSLDYYEGRSQTVCSGSYLVKEMEKQQEKRQRSPQKSTVFHDYMAVCFQRGSDKTRMPANTIMLFIAFTLVVPFPLIAAVAHKFDIIHATYPTMRALPLLSLLILGTVGNLQVFHGTLAVRGKETVSSASWMVAVTVVIEMVLVFSCYIHVMGLNGFVQFLYCIQSEENCPSTYERTE